MKLNIIVIDLIHKGYIVMAFEIWFYDQKFSVWKWCSDLLPCLSPERSWSRCTNFI